MVNYTLKEKILKLLIENKKNPLSIRDISKKLKADYKNTFVALKNINPKIYTKKKIGNSQVIQFNSLNSMEIISVEAKRTEEFLKNNPKLKIIKNYIEEMNYPFFIFLVFGSYINNKNSKNSDIDVCLISDNKNKTKELQNKLNLLSLKLEVQEFTIEEFISMIDKKSNNLGKEIIKNNILLYGVENYYNLISKWTRKE